MDDIEEKPKFGPASETQRSFLQNKSKFCIYGGGEMCASTLKTIL